MGSLLQPKTGRRYTLRPRVLIGRSRRCELTLPHRSISAEHAVIWWDDGQWMFRDLGSRNGSRIDGRAVDGATPVVLTPASELRFGNYPLSWTVESVAEPTPMAVAVDGDAVVVAADEILALPEGESPVAVIYGDQDTGWQLEQGDDVRAVHDLDVIVVAETPWRLHLPQRLAPTAALDDGPIELSELTLEFEVSADEEHVSLVARAGSRRVALDSRAHHYALLVLARARLADAELGSGEQGWVYHDELMKMLDVDREQLNMTVYRARKQLAAAGIHNAHGLIERRTDSRQLRLGVARIELRQG